MAQRNIDFGSFPGDPNADAIRTAFDKVQQNFTELFNNKKEQVYSVNRTPGAGIVLSTAPTGNVVVNAKIAQVRIQSSTLDLSVGIPGVGSQAVITSGAVPIFINLPANIAGVSNIDLTGTLTANTVNVNLQINGNTATFSGNLTTLTNLTANNANISANVNANIVNANYLYGDGSNISGITKILNGTSYANIPAAGGNLDIVIDANAAMTVSSTGANIAKNLGVAGITSLGLLGNVKITGGLTGQYIRTDGAGNLSFSTVGDADNVLYVSKSGNDSNDGKTLNSAKLTIKAAVAIATPGTNIFVKAGDYTEQNPISLATRVTIVGDNLRAVTIRPANPTQDILWVRPGCYVTGVTFRDHLEPSAAVAFPPTGAGFVYTSPYVQNCSSITTTGCGMRINGNYAGGLKSMVVDSFTQFNQGGKGIHILNSGYAQLVSVFTICTTIGVHCESGGQCSISNSNNSFGDYALVSDGHSPVLYTGVVDNFINGAVTVSGLSTRPKVNNSFQFDGDVNGTWYTVRKASALVGDVSIVEFDQPPGLYPAPGAVVRFYQASFISASGQTLEYVGTGTDILTATPNLGGIPIQENEVVQTNGGIVNWTSTDQFGDFRIGEGLVIKEEAGIIEGPAFERGLFTVLTPYILALENN